MGGSVLSKVISIVAGALDSKVANARLVGVKVLSKLYVRAEKEDIAIIKK